VAESAPEPVVEETPPSLPPPAVAPPQTPARPSKTLKLPKLNTLLEHETKTQVTETAVLPSAEPAQDFTSDMLRQAWLDFAGSRKKYVAEFQLLNQEVSLRGHEVVLHLHNSFQETLLNTLKLDLGSFLRERLNNSRIVVTGELQFTEEKKIIYTNREKFEHLAQKNPALKELKDRLGLDTDF
jgi:DNA polymerase-3 subunit gamma/tau